MSFGRDGDGYRVFDSHQKILDSMLEGGNLKSGYYAPPPLPENKRALLRYLMANRGATMAKCSEYLDVAVDKTVYDMHAVGYIEGDGRYLNRCRLFVTDKGKEAYNRRQQQGVTVEVKYKPYVPEKPPSVREGAEQALAIKSKGTS